jgi:hypothetical protein
MTKRVRRNKNPEELTYPCWCDCCQVAPIYLNNKQDKYNHKTSIKKSNMKRELSIEANKIISQVSTMVELDSSDEQIKKKLKNIVATNKVKPFFPQLRQYFVEKDSKVTDGNVYLIYYHFIP